MQKALIVDDSRTAQKVLGMQLKKLDILFDTVDSGEEALEYLLSQSPDVIFLDHMMPGMDGFQTLKAIKSNISTKSIPVIMFTSQSAQKYIDEAKVLGACEVIAKQASADIVAKAMVLASASTEREEEVLELETENLSDMMDATFNVDVIRQQILDHLQKDLKVYFEKGLDQIRVNNETVIHELRRQQEQLVQTSQENAAKQAPRKSKAGWMATAAIIALLVVNAILTMKLTGSEEMAAVIAKDHSLLHAHPDKAAEGKPAALSIEDLKVLTGKISLLEQGVLAQQLTLIDINETQSQLLEAQQLQLQSIETMTELRGEQPLQSDSAVQGAAQQ